MNPTPALPAHVLARCGIRFLLRRVSPDYSGCHNGHPVSSTSRGSASRRASACIKGCKPASTPHSYTATCSTPSQQPPSSNHSVAQKRVMQKRTCIYLQRIILPRTVMPTRKNNVHTRQPITIPSSSQMLSGREPDWRLTSHDSGGHTFGPVASTSPRPPFARSSNQKNMHPARVCPPCNFVHFSLHSVLRSTCMVWRYVRTLV